MNTVKVLSLDGKHYRTEITLDILKKAKIEEKVGKLNKYFDYIIGTGSGGIAAILLMLGFNINKSIKFVRELYKIIGSNINGKNKMSKSYKHLVKRKKSFFKKSKKKSNSYSIISTKFDPMDYYQKIYHLLYKYKIDGSATLKNYKSSNYPKIAIVCTFNRESKEPMLLKNYETSRSSVYYGTSDCTIVQVILACITNSLVCEKMHIAQFNIYEGSELCQNPTNIGKEELKLLYNNKDTYIVSVGTGNISSHFETEKKRIHDYCDIRLDINNLSLINKNLTFIEEKNRIMDYIKNYNQFGTDFESKIKIF